MPATVLKYSNPQNLFDHMPNHNGPSAFQCNPFNNKTAAALLSTSNAHTNFMYANWIDVHAKTSDQTNYLFCLQGNWFQFKLLIYSPISPSPVSLCAETRLHPHTVKRILIR